MPDLSQPTSGFKQHLYGAFGLTLLIALYLLPGSIGHDPWRGDDVRHFGVVYGMLNGEAWLFPHVAGTPSAEFPPFYYWVAAALATALGWLLPLHDAARLATPFFVGLAIFWIARASSRLHGKHTRVSAALLTLGTLGLVVHAHEIQPMSALMAMQAMTLAGLALIPAQPVKGSLQAAAGTGLAFLSAGLPGLVLTFPLLFLVAIGCPECRNPRASGALILGLTLALGISALWPIALNYQSPDLLAHWWHSSWSDLGGDAFTRADLPRLLELIGWATWPLWPIAIWSLWMARRQLHGIAWMLPIAALLLAATLIFLRGSFDAAGMLPLIPPFVLLAAAGVPRLRRGAANAFDWFAVMTFAVFGALIWLAWSAQAFFWPPGLARSLERMAPEFVLVNTYTQALLGIAIVTAWAILVWRMPRSPHRGAANWALGMTMLWCLAVSLLTPWFDHSRNYRPVSESLAIAIAGETPGCVAGLGLSSSHRASLHYFAGTRLEQVSANETACPYLLVHDDREPEATRPARPWLPIWEYRHAGGKRLEVFRLYRRD